MNMTTSSPIELLTLSFDLPLHRKELVNWRGAFNELARQCNNDIFHNHLNDGNEQSNAYHYRHPLIQYRIHRRKAAILAINEGIDAIHDVLGNYDWTLRWNNKPCPLKVADLVIKKENFELLAKPTKYRIRRWIALNQQNFGKWQKCKGLIQQASLLERILAAQILALCSSFKWRVPAHLDVSILEINQQKKVNIHKIPLITFDISFSTNIYIPRGLAIGKSISLGFGEISN